MLGETGGSGDTGKSGRHGGRGDRRIRRTGRSGVTERLGEKWGLGEIGVFRETGGIQGVRGDRGVR